MATCNHKFIGLGTGVRCLKCGLSMTAQEYREYINTTPAPKKKTAPKKKPIEAEPAQE